MKNYFFLLLFLLISGFVSAQYVVRSTHILNPDLNIDYVKNNADFWIKYAYDPTYGGFFSNVGRAGNVISSTDVRTNVVYKRKSLISQTRHGYGMTRAFMLTGDETYLTYAKSALDFLFSYGWDTANEGWYCFAKANGTIDHGQWWDPDGSYKWGFQQHYALVGIVANYEATRDDNVKNWMNKGIRSLYKNMWDPRPGFEGYYSDADLNWANKRDKGFTPTIDGITTNAELTYLVTQQPEHKQRLLDLAYKAVNYLVADMDKPTSNVYFHEYYNSDWVVDNTKNEISIGHAIKTAWCLGRAYLCDTTKKELKAGAEKILDETWNFKNGTITAWDHVNGGPFMSLQINTADGLNSIKDYWTVEQGFTGPMINYYITKNPIYLQMADQSMDFFMKYLVDKQYGEIFSNTNAAGVTDNTNKGDDFKASYHSIEMGYYGYLYSKLYYLHQPANLYYKIAAKATNQHIKLTPIPIEEGRLRIKAVTLDGANYTDFDATSRTLNIAANIGGKFKVTYDYVAEVLSGTKLSNSAEISVYPNPAEDRIQISGLEDIHSVSIVDLSGKELMKRQPNELKTIVVDIENFRQGVYFVIMQNSDGFKITRKLIRN